MPRVDVVVRSVVSSSSRCRQLEGMFDVPAEEKSTRRWSFDAPIESREWSIGLIVGPSGAGKSTVARQMFGDLVDAPIEWGSVSVIDDFKADYSMDEIAAACQAVGFGTIPAWRRPFYTLSNGEQFRVSLARRMLESGGLCVVDEFTSVVDRQVAKIGSNAVQKYTRKTGKQFVAVTCHNDVEDWLQPDWVIEPHEESFRWRSVQRRPFVECEIRRVDISLWRTFAPYHYMSAELHRAAQCFALFVDGKPAAFAGVLHRPHAKTKNLKGLSRVVVLPDFQGLGLAFALTDTLGGAYRSAGFYLHSYPSHPTYVRSRSRSPSWALRKRPGTYSGAQGDTGADGKASHQRPCAVFRYCGPANKKAAAALLGA